MEVELQSLWGNVGTLFTVPYMIGNMFTVGVNCTSVLVARITDWTVGGCEDVVDLARSWRF